MIIKAILFNVVFWSALTLSIEVDAKDFTFNSNHYMIKKFK